MTAQGRELRKGGFSGLGLSFTAGHCSAIPWRKVTQSPSDEGLVWQPPRCVCRDGLVLTLILELLLSFSQNEGSRSQTDLSKDALGNPRAMERVSALAGVPCQGDLPKAVEAVCP